MQKKTRVRIYRNLRNKKLSIKVGTYVVGYCDEVTLSNPSFVISKSGKKRAIETRQRNVHAFIEGTIESITNFLPHKGRGSFIHEKIDLFCCLGTKEQCSVIQISYNPFSKNGFYDVNYPEKEFVISDQMRYIVIQQSGEIYAITYEDINT